MQQCCHTRGDRNAVDHTQLITSTRSWPLLKIRLEFAPSVRKKERTVIHSIWQVSAWNRHQGGWGPRTCCFARSCNTASMLPVCGKTTTLPLCPMFGYAPKIYLKWKILHEVLSKLGDTHRCHSWLKGKSKLPRLLGTRDHKTFTLYIGRYHF